MPLLLRLAAGVRCDQLKKKHRVLPLRLKKKKPPQQQQQQQRKENKPSIGGFLYKHVLRWDDVLWSDADAAYTAVSSCAPSSVLYF